MQTPQAGQPGMSFFKGRRLAQARVHEFTVVSKFLGYRNREDITNLPPGILVVGSQNVLHNVSDRIQIRQGYKLDGAVSTTIAPIRSSFDWFTRGNGERHIRVGFLTSAANDGKLQFRYSDSTGTITWTDLLTSLTTDKYQFTTIWDVTEQLRLILFVNGGQTVGEWNGAYDTVVSITSNTITMTNNIGTSGFYSTRNKQITIRGVTYTYTGISGSTFTGVSPDPTAQGGNTPVAGDLAYQNPISTNSSSFTSGPASTYNLDLISTLNNQVFIGSLTSPTFYMSKIGSYTDYSFSSPRLPAEGATGTLDANIVAFVPQEDVMYISAGKDFWYNTSLVQQSTFNGTAAITIENFSVKLLKVNPRQGAQSQALVSKMKNYVLFVSNEPTFDMFGRIEDILGTPQTKNLSDSIKLDFDTYDFTDGMVFYWRWYLLITVPKSGLLLVYNLATNAWEAPQTIPVSRLYTVNGNLYGHSYQSPESYQLFTGYADRVYTGFTGNPILAQANFSYQNDGVRTMNKNANEFYIEGYISANTVLNCNINYDLDGNLTNQSFAVSGSDSTAVALSTTSNALGKNQFGKQPLGSQIVTSLTGLPPKFRVIKTFPRFNYFECQFSFSTLGSAQQFELLAFGLNSAPASDTNFDIKE